MILWIRNAVLLMIILMITYGALSFSMRQRHRRKLKDEYELSDKSEDKSEFIAKGMMDYQKSYRPKLILGVFLAPIFVFFLLLYLANRS